MIPKFRAWDKRSKEMWKVSTLHIEDEYVDLFKKNIYENPLNDPWAKFGDVILMQSTGLKDKNGVEIFEGDILKIIEVTNEGISEYITDVIWEDCSFVFKSDGVDYYDSFLGSFSGDPNKTYPLFELLVIGNVWDNPELLESVQNERF
ncbi:YopX family protein [Enterococcus faecalis]|uniref:YopX family protein n=1 Tax=Enterococcus faecalis TaxID=1351 RepID=UPI001926E211|nr:YopX family protein [Enterococcus faecalis]EGO8804145.1 DNA-packaging protein [Enterococcus faecalis]EHU8854889.1 DNA-packaging protein [Enterococcus faecalis]MCM6933707.1 YopX family protein [Enterococcus faecalis]MDF4248098.1 YopX family protein [Enterococcus faecalis]MDK4408723.1 YopX family protein [Enterococcus faecalis]